MTASPFAHLWRLDPNFAFLNHGSFGATPISVLEAQRHYQDQLESRPIEFLAPERLLEPKLDAVRLLLAQLLNTPTNSIAWVHNATDGVNAVVRSFPWNDHDEVLITNHGYNACNNAVRYVAERHGLQVHLAKIPFPLHSSTQILDAIFASVTPRTRLLLVDHVTSFSGLVFPLAEIIEEAHRRQIRVLVDGAHAPGMIDVDLHSLQPDYYTANHHKWLCAPKASGFLYVREEWQHEVRPTVISHAANRSRPNRSRFLAEFDWTGTFDPTPLMALQDASRFFFSLFPTGYQQAAQANHHLALQARSLLLDALHIPAPAPESMIGALVSLPLPHTNPPTNPSSLQPWLFDHHHIEVPVFVAPDTSQPCLRIACQLYNHLDQYRQLADALQAWFAQSTSLSP